MPTTGPPHNLSYPVSSDTPDVPRDIKQDAEDTARELAAVKTVADAAMPKSGGTFTGRVRFNGEIEGPAAGFYVNTGYLIVQSGPGVPAPVAHAYAAFPNQSATLGQVGSPSSRAFKTRIKPLSSAAARTMFDRVEPVTYDYRANTDWADDHDKARPHCGFIAEDVEAAGLGVRHLPDGTVIGLRDSELIAVLWATVRDLTDRVTALEGQ